MHAQDLPSIAKAMVAPGKGILAADESLPTIEKRLRSIEVESTEENRRSYRELLLTTPGLEQHISAIIMFEETLGHSTADGIRFVELVRSRGIVPGIKVDKGAKLLAGHDGEKITEGLDGLRGRLEGYHAIGARFTKWRAVITIGDGIPTRGCIHANAEALARFAALSQEAGLVPIVEPEVLMDGSHTFERCFETSVETFHRVFDALHEHDVMLEGMVLKPNMVVSGKACPVQAGVPEVAEQTLRCLLRTVPAAVPGIAFLSGGQSNELATAHLNAINTLGPLPWQVSFSYGRALQDPPLRAWRGEAANVANAQQALLHRAKCNGAARSGAYQVAMEQELIGTPS